MQDFLLRGAGNPIPPGYLVFIKEKYAWNDLFPLMILSILSIHVKTLCPWAGVESVHLAVNACSGWCFIANFPLWSKNPIQCHRTMFSRSN